MATPPARVAQVRTAQRAAGADPSQDRMVVLPAAVAVLDGASAPEAAERDGGWYAEQLAAELADRLGATGVDLRTVLSDSIAAVASAHRLRPGGSSSTVAMLRWSADRADGLVLGDSSLVAFVAGGAVEELVDERLAAVAPAQRDAYHDRLRAGSGYDEEHRALLRRLVGEQRRYRNAPDGYWIAEAEPAAARHALTRNWPVAGLDAVVLATDGVAHGVGRAGLPTWSAVRDLAAARGPGAVLEAVRAAETDDPDGRRWPRSKRHDDQSLVVVSWV